MIRPIGRRTWDMEEGELAATSNCAIKDHAAGSIREPDQNSSLNSWS